MYATLITIYSYIPHGHYDANQTRGRLNKEDCFNMGITLYDATQFTENRGYCKQTVHSTGCQHAVTLMWSRGSKSSSSSQ